MQKTISYWHRGHKKEITPDAVIELSKRITKNGADLDDIIKAAGILRALIRNDDGDEV